MLCKKKVIVIDACESVFAGTSGTNTGAIHYKYPDQRHLEELGEYSFDLYEEWARDPTFQEAVGWRSESCFGISKQSLPAGEPDDVLDWIRRSKGWQIDPSFLGVRNATINPSGLGDWLLLRCKEMGVRFMPRVKAINAYLHPDNRMRSVMCSTARSAAMIPCSALVIAAGSWTPEVYEKLFEDSCIQFASVTDASDWMLLRMPRPFTHSSIAFTGLNEVVGEKFEFSGRNDRTIWLCGRRENQGTFPPVDGKAEPEPGVIAKFIGWSYKYLNYEFAQDPEEFKALEVLKFGRAFRPSTPSGKPVMGKVPRPLLRRTYGNLSNTSKDTVFICWGHGSHGLALGPGVGKIMSQLVRGLPRLDVSLEEFGIPDDGAGFRDDDDD